ncbi:cation:proton antiporter family protein [Pseudomonas sp.]|uniref:cation:proton antiporter n=1 Tax=Pseudomonas sp. TaxID=306 RepID=UPI002CEE5011|nr:cation:proton antiporter family protein [Pseudomonas sp.]HUE92172.1 cation:proton antiporter family protein [Pseudomonas sp.]
MSLFQEVAVLLALSALVGAIAVKLRQPLIIAYILVGILAGPAVLGLSSENEPLELLAEIGITVLLFVVGLKLDMRLVRTLGPVALATGLGQLTFTIIFGYGLCYLLGLEWLTALYVAVALTFSSTIIIVKLLSDKGEIDSLHGRIAMGFLIVQDIAVVLAMLGLNLYQPSSGEQQGMHPLALLAILLGSLAVLFLLMRYALPRLLDSMASSPELLMLIAIAWGILLAAGADTLGLSKEIGAFLAGFSLASTPLREAVASRLTSLRDFLLLFFFLHLGLQLDFAHIHGQIGSALVLSAFVLIGNPLIVMAIMGWMGYRKRTGFMAGLTVAQISEFSIIFVAMGIGLGHVGPDALGLTTLVGLITITLSTYMILYSQALFDRLAPWLGIFERHIPHRENANDSDPQNTHAQIIIYGMGRYGRQLAHQLEAGGLRVLGVDFDPGALAEARNEGLSACYGDAEDNDFLEHLPLNYAQAMISTIPQREVNAILLRALRASTFKGKITLSAFRTGDAEALERAGAASVLRPYSDAAETAARRLLSEISER